MTPRNTRPAKINGFFSSVYYICPFSLRTVVRLIGSIIAFTVASWPSSCIMGLSAFHCEYFAEYLVLKRLDSIISHSTKKGQNPINHKSNQNNKNPIINSCKLFGQCYLSENVPNFINDKLVNSCFFFLNESRKYLGNWFLS